MTNTEPTAAQIHAFAEFLFGRPVAQRMMMNAPADIDFDSAERIRHLAANRGCRFLTARQAWTETREALFDVLAERRAV